MEGSAGAGSHVGQAPYKQQRALPAPSSLRLTLPILTTKGKPHCQGKFIHMSSLTRKHAKEGEYFLHFTEILTKILATILNFIERFLQLLPPLPLL